MKKPDMEILVCKYLLSALFCYCLLFYQTEAGSEAWCKCSGEVLPVNGTMHCFELLNSTINSWVEAEEACATVASHLAHFASREVYENLTLYLSKNYEKPIMVGYTVGNQEKDLIATVCQQNIYYGLIDNNAKHFLISGEPTGNKSCFFLENNDYKLHYGNCNQEAQVLCERPYGQDYCLKGPANCTIDTTWSKIVETGTTVVTKSMQSSGATDKCPSDCAAGSVPTFGWCIPWWILLLLALLLLLLLCCCIAWILHCCCKMFMCRCQQAKWTAKENTDKEIQTDQYNEQRIETLAQPISEEPGSIGNDPGGYYDSSGRPDVVPTPVDVPYVENLAELPPFENEYENKNIPMTTEVPQTKLRDVQKIDNPKNEDTAAGRSTLSKIAERNALRLAKAANTVESRSTTAEELRSKTPDKEIKPNKTKEGPEIPMEQTEIPNMQNELNGNSLKEQKESKKDEMESSYPGQKSSPKRKFPGETIHVGPADKNYDWDAIPPLNSLIEDSGNEPDVAPQLAKKPKKQLKTSNRATPIATWPKTPIDDPLQVPKKQRPARDSASTISKVPMRFTSPIQRISPANTNLLPPSDEVRNTELPRSLSNNSKQKQTPITPIENPKPSSVSSANPFLRLARGSHGGVVGGNSRDIPVGWKPWSRSPKPFSDRPGFLNDD